jgi:hypothetical protein
MSNPLDLFRWLLPWIPVVAIWIVGVILALITWRRHPTVSLLALLGCILLMISSLGGSVLHYWVILQQANQAWTNNQLGWVLSILGFVRMSLSAVAHILFLCAIFGWRSQSMSHPSNEPWPRPKAEINPYGEINRGSSEDVENRPRY